MYTINNTINETTFDDLQIEKIISHDSCEVLHISVEKDAVFPKHTSPRDATLLLIEGNISFFIKSEEYKIEKHQFFKFPKDKEHWVTAKSNSKFLIIR